MWGLVELARLDDFRRCLAGMPSAFVLHGLEEFDASGGWVVINAGGDVGDLLLEPPPDADVRIRRSNSSK
jgi:hypothetical protein